VIALYRLQDTRLDAHSATADQTETTSHAWDDYRLAWRLAD